MARSIACCFSFVVDIVFSFFPDSGNNCSALPEPKTV
jgi:hypothetical protein